MDGSSFDDLMDAYEAWVADGPTNPEQREQKRSNLEKASRRYAAGLYMAREDAPPLGKEILSFVMHARVGSINAEGSSYEYKWKVPLMSSSGEASLWLDGPELRDLIVGLGLGIADESGTLIGFNQTLLMPRVRVEVILTEEV